MGVLFASIGRQPHFWTLPPHDEPADLIARLFANEFEDVGDRLLLVARDEAGTRRVVAVAARREHELERLRGISDPSPMAWRRPITSVLLTAFLVDDERRPGVIAETLSSLADPRFMHYLVGATTSRWRSPAGPRSTASRICRRSGRSSRSGGPGWVDTCSDGHGRQARQEQRVDPSRSLRGQRAGAALAARASAYAMAAHGPDMILIDVAILMR